MDTQTVILKRQLGKELYKRMRSALLLVATFTPVLNIRFDEQTNEVVIARAWFENLAEFRCSLDAFSLIVGSVDNPLDLVLMVWTDDCYDFLSEIIEAEKQKSLLGTA